MISLAKYKKLSYNFKKPFIVHKGIRYTLSTREGEDYKIIEQGDSELYELAQHEIKQQRKSNKHTSKNYHTMEEVLGVNPKHKQITCNYTICKNVEQAQLKGTTIEDRHQKVFNELTRKKYRALNRELNQLIPQQMKVTTIIKHIAQDTTNNWTTDINGNLVKVTD